MKNRLLAVASLCEALTGLALLIVPTLVARLLLGAELTGVSIPVARVLGIALIALGVACWPGPALAGMLTYGAAVTVYLAYLGLVGGFAGILLWPAQGAPRKNHTSGIRRWAGPIRDVGSAGRGDFTDLANTAYGDLLLIAGKTGAFIGLGTP
jgi:hypothetical protein